MAHFYFSDLDLITICRSVGLIGFAIYATAFFCLSVGKLDSSRPLYFGMMLAASSCVMVSLWADFNLSAALIQGFYILMSLGGIMIRYRRIWDDQTPA
ncbi:hypothetical protein V8J82_00815 [Gymnodinialimonas sp. 2305UL16-5]|uniref:CBU_0592 family membrane protein n=1 Tax=Gymnodinialimonas mytili TaxID=3126503 RepID=UPI0030A71E7A